MVSDDLGHNPTPAQTATSTIAVNVSAVDDAPLNHLFTAQSTSEDTPLTMSSASGNAVSVSDVDADTGDLTVTLTVTSGTLTLGSTNNLTSFTNNAASITLTGTVGHVNTALDGLTYTPRP